MIRFFGLFVAAFAILTAQCEDEIHKRNAWLMPIGRVVLTPSISDSTAVSFLGEAGLRNARANLTAGTQFEFGRIKASAEYLTQRLTYDFATGKTHNWVNQGAIGLHYQQLIDCNIIKAADLKGFYSYAGSRTLSPKRCEDVLFERRIAGSNAYSISAGAVVTPFCEDLLQFDVGYDHVKYRRRYHNDKIVRGIGGSVSYTLRLQECIDLNLKAEFRRPYNYYGIKFAWHRDRNWTVGLWAGYTAGKYHLPRSTSAGIEFSYLFDGCGCNVRPECCPPLWSPCDIQAWVQTPAVYLPEVLAIAEQRAVCVGGPTSIPIPDQTISSISGTYNVSPFFSSPLPLTFSAVGLPEFVSIDPTTGVISANNADDQVVTVTVTASDSCGSTSQTFVLDLSSPA